MILYRDDGSLNGNYLAHELWRVQWTVWYPEHAAEGMLYFFFSILFESWYELLAWPKHGQRDNTDIMTAV